MADGTKENVIMTVELAIQRELVYRRKVAMLELRRDGDLRKDLLPLQVQPSGSSFTPSQSPDTMEKLESCQSITVAPRSNLQIPRPPNMHYNRQMWKDPKDNLFCKICQVTCPSPFNYRQHVKGYKHKSRVQELALGKEDRGEVANKRIWCQLCNIWCMNQDAYGQHLEGQKHQKAEFAKKNGEQIAKTQKWCGLCHIWCTDDASFGLHLKGKKHVLQLHAMEGKKRAREEDAMAERGAR